MKTATYTTGDKVAYYMPSRFGSNRPARFGVVAKVTGVTGVIVLENGRRFNEDGRELKSKVENHPNRRLVDVAMAEREIEAREQDNQTARTIRELVDFAKGCKSVNGQAYITEEYRARIVELAQAITVNRQD